MLPKALKHFRGSNNKISTVLFPRGSSKPQSPIRQSKGKKKKWWGSKNEIPGRSITAGFCAHSADWFLLKWKGKVKSPPWFKNQTVSLWVPRRMKPTSSVLQSASSCGISGTLSQLLFPSASVHYTYKSKQASRLLLHLIFAQLTHEQISRLVGQR